MKKLMTIAAGVVAGVSTMAFAADEVELPAVEGQVEAAEAEEMEEESDEKAWSIGVDFDFFSAYVWRNAIMNDQIVIQPCVWGEYNVKDYFTIGGFIWQNYDLTHQRRLGGYKNAMTETDYELYVKRTLWASDDEEEEEEESRYHLDLTLGHDWYTYHGVRKDGKSSDPDTRELFLKAEFVNPLVTVYGQVSWMYADFGEYSDGFYYELGLNREYEVEDLTVGADVSVGFADKAYTYFLYGEPGKGLGGVTVKTYASYAITDWVSIKGTLAYTGVLNGNIRNAMTTDGEEYDFYGDCYPRDLLWGGVSLNFEF